MRRNAALSRCIHALPSNGAEQFRAISKGRGMDEVYRMHRRVRDRTRIRADDYLEMRYWATTLRCTESALRAAIAVVGTGSDGVRGYLELARVRGV